jgi:hypothetical protein
MFPLLPYFLPSILPFFLPSKYHHYPSLITFLPSLNSLLSFLHAAHPPFLTFVLWKGPAHAPCLFEHKEKAGRKKGIQRYEGKEGRKAIKVGKEGRKARKGRRMSNVK